MPAIDGPPAKRASRTMLCIAGRTMQPG